MVGSEREVYPDPAKPEREALVGQQFKIMKPVLM